MQIVANKYCNNANLTPRRGHHAADKQSISEAQAFQGSMTVIFRP
jgi:hypothetical protein